MKRGYFGCDQGIVGVETGLKGAHFDQNGGDVLVVFEVEFQNSLGGFKVVFGVHEAQEDIFFIFSDHVEGLSQFQQLLFFSTDLNILFIDVLPALLTLVGLYFPPEGAGSIDGE